jgi:hypothetical protein
MAIDLGTARPQSPAWTIRPYRSGDERMLVALFQRVFGRSISEAHWRWKLKTRRAPTENVWLAVHDDRPIFQCAGIPMRYRLEGRERDVMIAVDAMTAPDLQRRGLLTAVGQHAYAAWRAAGIAFVIGLPNQRWGSRAGALGWVDLFPLRWMIRPLRPEILFARRAHLPVVARMSAVGRAWNACWSRTARRDAAVATRSVTHAGAEFDSLWEGAMDDHRVSPVRDREWVNWRYFMSPVSGYHVRLAERTGRPVGYAAYTVEERSGRRAGAIAEVFTTGANVAARDTLIGDVLDEMIAGGAELARALAIPGTSWYRTLRRTGFFPRASFRVQLVPLGRDLPLTTLRDPRNWSLAGGDFDVI